MHTRREILAGSLGTALAATACSPRRDDRSTIRIAMTSDVRSLMPGGNPDSTNGTILQHIYEGLVAARSDGGVELMLAQSVERSPDGRTYTFVLRNGITFHNGQPLTSAEVVWTWQQFMKPKSRWPGRTAFNGTQHIDLTSVTAPDPRTVVFTLAKPSLVFLDALARPDLDSCGIAHPESLRDGRWKRPIGTGPFRFDNLWPGEATELSRFDGYQSRGEPTDGLTGRKTALVERLRFVSVKDDASASLALRSGDVDLYFDAGKSTAEDLARHAGITVVSANVAGTYHLILQTDDPVLRDPRVRQAMNLAIDKPRMVKALYGEYAQPHESFVTATSSLYTERMKHGLGYDPARARRLLREAGYAGQTIAIQTNPAPKDYVAIAVILQAMLRQVGMNVAVQAVENASKVANFQAGAYQATVLFGAPNVNPVFWFERLIGSKAKAPIKVWDDPAATALLDRLLAAGTLDAQRAIADEMHALWLQDAPMLVWANRVTVTAYRQNLKGYEPWAGLRARLWNVSLG